MKTQDEIQKAHDILVAVLLGEIDVGATGNEHLNIAATVLCWVLEHEHNHTFQDILKDIDDEARSRGYVLEKQAGRIGEPGA